MEREALGPYIQKASGKVGKDRTFAYRGNISLLCAGLVFTIEFLICMSCKPLLRSSCLCLLSWSGEGLMVANLTQPVT